MLDPKVDTFLCVCREMNYTKAAKILHISQPAVSQQIKALEDYYGFPLFYFEGKRFVLSEYGKKVYDTLSSMKNNEGYLLEQLQIIKNNSSIINMGTTLTVGEFLIADPISQYLKKYPDTNMNVTVTNTKELLAKLDAGEIDFAVLEGDYPKTAYSHRTLYVEEFIPVCHSGHVFAVSTETNSLVTLASGRTKPAPPSLRDLLQETLILREPGSGTRRIFESTLEQYGLSTKDFHNTVTIGNMNAIVDMVMADCGITFLYKKAVLPQLKEKTLCEISLPDFHIEHEISIVWKKHNLQDNYIKELIRDLFQVEVS